MEPIARLLIILRKVLRPTGRSIDDTDDLIQEAFLRLQTYRRSRHIDEPEAFLVRTVKNLYVDMMRQRARRGTHVTADNELLHLLDPTPAPDEVLVHQQNFQKLKGGLCELSPRTREVLLLYRIDGLSHAQIAAQLQISVSAVEKHIAKAMLHLSEWMAE
ncbi:RNA polymerase sigma factor [Steroidobacter sp.]|uniref:RNA polymerase sigma factor n=1 Tax=Steroidobacter sp. TaxID=1978227 RepID=UPI001A4DC684|nr:RNA polymerase sigma factor [Steroidobacter sp.]MBL8270619.1 RNA polymerase sigma factor [Steroidobacter sp.]